ncbi:Malonyl CoA-acyl carrier protein transacylase [Anaerohalosphaera lusitana]|uniref:Malonyl CoA-acyl carrier protein transacylase n=1 Tax=Anaerohalosphaera lusitana TaxID=1936003 RepID=A0A1U9NML0_9BACT|nr:ACP S-malonyltransferase [Anaerohalosphaera lusitana]AQT69161.1 Malonyl CoA-acyl carrier protein transacylase [Anaerohalosphaera lusitana]
MKTAFLFPGQGAQFVGMGKDLAEEFEVCASVFEKANSIVGYDLRDICFNGPDEKLNSTTVSQPAIFTMSAAILELLKTLPETKDIKPDVTAGLSLGEYTALYAAGVISFEDGLKLVQKRGNAMQEAADATDGSMVSIIGLEPEKVDELCEEAAQGELLKGANYNCPGQVVVSGAKGACERALGLAEKYGAMKAVELKVAGAFHTEMMAPAGDKLKDALDSCDVNEPADTKVIANVTADYYSDSQSIRSGLVNQLVKPILWQKCMEKLLGEGVEEFYEIGPGRVLTGLMRRIHRKTRVKNISKAEAVKDLQAKLSGK